MFRKEAVGVRKSVLFLAITVPSKRNLQVNLAVSSTDSSIDSSSSTVICTVNKIHEMRARLNRLRSVRSRSFLSPVFSARERTRPGEIPLSHWNIKFV